MESVNRRIAAMDIGNMSKKELRELLNAIVDAINLLANTAGQAAAVSAIIKKD